MRAGFPELFVVAFKAETVGSVKELESRREGVPAESKADMVVANDVSAGAAFGSDYNELADVTKRRTVHLARDLKTNLVVRLLGEIAAEIRGRGRSP